MYSLRHEFRSFGNLSFPTRINLRWCCRSSVKTARSSLVGSVSLTRISSTRRCTSPMRHNLLAIPCMAGSLWSHPIATSDEVGVLLQALSVSPSRTLETRVTVQAKPLPPPKPLDPPDPLPLSTRSLNPAMFRHRNCRSSDPNGTRSGESPRFSCLSGSTSPTGVVQYPTHHCPRTLGLPSRQLEGIRDVSTGYDSSPLF
ncbi:unnamed protein product [Arabis nemorensis]|uniref:Uncharacterized protein n=1 Tax=Arabis nemorensis TaxID=586526 RepID=A0A565CAH9_9BRAS|nr:unnamed protein product [Arabis nemorensis]